MKFLVSTFNQAKALVGAVSKYCIDVRIENPKWDSRPSVVTGRGSTDTVTKPSWTATGKWKCWDPALGSRRSPNTLHSTQHKPAHSLNYKSEASKNVKLISNFAWHWKIPFSCHAQSNYFTADEANVSMQMCHGDYLLFLNHLKHVIGICSQ